MTTRSFTFSRFRTRPGHDPGGRQPGAKGLDSTMTPTSIAHAGFGDAV